MDPSTEAREPEEPMRQVVGVRLDLHDHASSGAAARRERRARHKSLGSSYIYTSLA